MASVETEQNLEELFDTTKDGANVTNFNYTKEEVEAEFRKYRALEIETKNIRAKACEESTKMFLTF